MKGKNLCPIQNLFFINSGAVFTLSSAIWEKIENFNFYWKRYMFYAAEIEN